VGKTKRKSSTCNSSAASCIMRDRHNNNDALLSQTWVIATVAVLRVRTVPYVEPHNVQGELDPCYSYSCCGRAR
jgi:hypothetical protein